MKKIIMLISVSCFYTVAPAQENNFLDIQKLLLKKQKENKPVYKLPFAKPLQNQFIDLQPGTIYLKNKFSHTLSNGDKVYLLSQDDMPCITTDMSQFRIPNVSTEYKNLNLTLPFNNAPGRIPNAAIPKRIYISK